MTKFLKLDHVVTFSFFVLIVTVLAVLYAFIAIVVTPQGFEYTHKHSGCYVKTLKPELRIIFPIIERIGARINMKEMVLSVPIQDVITKDNAMVKVDGAIFIPPEASQIIGALGGIFELAKSAFGNNVESPVSVSHSKK